MCTIVPIAKTTCPTGRAGIKRLYALPCSAIQSLTFDEDGIITEIVLDCDVATEWITIEFESDTAFFNQEKGRTGNNVFVSQTISFNEPVMNPTTRAALNDLNSCCCTHVIVQDNTGRYHYAGITYYSGLDSWQSEDMRTGDGSGNTGADSTADANQYIETLTATTGSYAPFLSDDPETITQQCNVNVFGPTAGGIETFGPTAAGIETFGP